MAKRPRLDDQPPVERTYTPHREAMRAVLRLVLGLPRRVPTCGPAVRSCLLTVFKGLSFDDRCEELAA